MDCISLVSPVVPGVVLPVVPLVMVAVVPVVVVGTVVHSAVPLVEL